MIWGRERDEGRREKGEEDIFFFFLLLLGAGDSGRPEREAWRERKTKCVEIRKQHPSLLFEGALVQGCAKKWLEFLLEFKKCWGFNCPLTKSMVYVVPVELLYQVKHSPPSSSSIQICWEMPPSGYVAPILPFWHYHSSD